MAELIPRVAKTYAITKTVTFDVDGTLIHTAALHAQCLIVVLQNSDVDMPSEDMCGQIGKGGEQILHGLILPDMHSS